MKKNRLFLAIFLILTITVATAFFTTSSSAEIKTSGSCGENVFWNLDTESGVLEISGAGAMTDYTFPDIPWYDYKDSIKTITIENGVTTIGNYAFYVCSELTNIIIPDSINSIGSYAFYYCSELTNIIIPDSVNSIGSYAFYYCSKLTNIIIPDGISTIEKNTFTYCLGLNSIIIPDSVNTIGYNAFSNCISLTNITIPHNINSIAGGAFSNCFKLMEIYNLSNLNITIGSEKNGEIGLLCKVVHSSLSEKSILTTSDEYIFSYFDDSYYLLGYIGTDNELTLPSGFMCDGNVIKSYKIYQYAFYNCTGIISIIIPDSVTSIGDKAFQDSENLEKITIPGSITSMGVFVFSNCNKLTNVIASDGITSFGYAAFYNCISLTNINIPNSVTSIEDYTFRSCSSLTGVIIPDGVLSIGDRAFRDCTGLTGLTISKNLILIREYAFEKCINLKTVNYGGTATDWETLMQNIGNDNEYLTSANIIFKQYKIIWNVDGIETTDITVSGIYPNSPAVRKKRQILNTPILSMIGTRKFLRLHRI